MKFSDEDKIELIKAMYKDELFLGLVSVWHDYDGQRWVFRFTDGDMWAFDYERNIEPYRVDEVMGIKNTFIKGE